MIRIKAALIFGGVFLVLFGLGDLWFNLWSPADPTPVDLAALERGETTDAAYMEFGPHVALFPHGISSTRGEGFDAQLEYIIYPIVSASHSDYHQFANFRFEGVDSFDNMPGFGSAAVLVLNYDYGHFLEVPQEFETRESMRGMSAGNFDSLNSNMRNAIKKHFPGQQYDKMIFITENQSPSLLRGILMLLGGLALIGVGAVMFLKMPT
ncbi:MAG: hypothetical protein RIC55_17175 [Pirellulaceae bacterium]